jgi:hypothetical protein
MLDGETRVAIHKLAERFPLVGGGVVQQNDYRASQMAKQLA